MSHAAPMTHPLVEHHLARLRDAATPAEEFRHLARRLSALLVVEATRNLPTEPVTVRTPLAETTGRRVAGRIGIVPILRAGLAMVEPVLDLLPSAEVWHLGVYRDEATAQPVEYYRKIPATHPVDVAIVLDPMLATGGSARAALHTLRTWRVPRLKLVALIASRPGVEALMQEFPDVELTVGAIDPELNAHKFIVPGLGDAGDRLFNTRG